MNSNTIFSFFSFFLNFLFNVYKWHRSKEPISMISMYRLENWIIVSIFGNQWNFFELHIKFSILKTNKQRNKQIELELMNKVSVWNKQCFYQGIFTFFHMTKNQWGFDIFQYIKCKLVYFISNVRNKNKNS